MIRTLGLSLALLGGGACSVSAPERLWPPSTPLVMRIGEARRIDLKQADRYTCHAGLLVLEPISGSMRLGGTAVVRCIE